MTTIDVSTKVTLFAFPAGLVLVSCAGNAIYNKVEPARSDPAAIYKTEGLDARLNATIHLRRPSQSLRELALQTVLSTSQVSTTSPDLSLPQTSHGSDTVDIRISGLASIETPAGGFLIVHDGIQNDGFEDGNDSTLPVPALNANNVSINREQCPFDKYINQFQPESEIGFKAGVWSFSPFQKKLILRASSVRRGASTIRSLPTLPDADAVPCSLASVDDSGGCVLGCTSNSGDSSVYYYIEPCSEDPVAIPLWRSKSIAVPTRIRPIPGHAAAYVLDASQGRVFLIQFAQKTEAPVADIAPGSEIKEFRYVYIIQSGSNEGQSGCPKLELSNRPRESYLQPGRDLKLATLHDINGDGTFNEITIHGPSPRKYKH